MSTKFVDEVENMEYRQDLMRYNTVTMQKITILDDFMNCHFKYIKDRFNFLAVAKDVESELCVALVHLHCSIFSEESLPFINKGKLFDWKSFETRTKADNARNMLKIL